MAGLISSERAQVEEPGIYRDAFRWRKAGQRTNKGIKARFQRSSLDRTVPVVALSLRSRKNEHRQHMLIGRPAFRALAPAQKTFQAHTHQPFIIKFRGEHEQAIPLVQHASLALLCANTESDQAISKEAHPLFTIQETMRHVTLPVPANETRPPSLDCHGICGIVNETIDH